MILSGGAHPGRPAEAEVAARLAARLGVPEEARVLETASLSTADNARLCAPLVSGPIIVVTDDYHLFRAIRHFQRHLAYPVYGAASWSEGVKMPLREVPAALWTAARS